MRTRILDFEDDGEELLKMEDFRKAQKAIERKGKETDNAESV